MSSATLYFQNSPQNQCESPPLLPPPWSGHQPLSPGLQESTLMSCPRVSSGPSWLLPLQEKADPSLQPRGPQSLAAFSPLGPIWPSSSPPPTQPHAPPCCPLNHLRVSTFAIDSRTAPCCSKVDLMGSCLMTLLNLQTPSPLPALSFPQHGYHLVMLF